MSEQYIIGEGVILDARPASFMLRILGFIIDVVVYGAVTLGIAIVLYATGAISFDYGDQIVILLLATGIIVVPMTVETLSRGRSLGKLATGIRVVRDDGGPITIRHAFVRATLGIVELVMTSGALALVVMLFNSRGKRIGDFLAGTYAIRVRAKKTTTQQLSVPAPLRPWASLTEISRLPDGLGLACQQFLARRIKMDPVSRATMAHSLAQQLAAHVAPQPPFAVPAEEYITAVIAERSQREARIETRKLEHAERIQQQMTQLPFGIR